MGLNFNKVGDYDTLFTWYLRNGDGYRFDYESHYFRNGKNVGASVQMTKDHEETGVIRVVVDGRGDYFQIMKGLSKQALIEQAEEQMFFRI